MTEHNIIEGRTYGQQVLASPIPIKKRALLKQNVLFSEEDERLLRLADEILADQTETILAFWDDFLGRHLLRGFNQHHQPGAPYQAAVRKRFGQWIFDTHIRPHGQAWLAYQQERALRHHVAKTSQTDGANAEPTVCLTTSWRSSYRLIRPSTAFWPQRGMTPTR